MAERKAAAKRSKKTVKPTDRTSAKGFTAEERAAMRERVQELKAAAGKAEGAKAVLAKIAAMQGSDRAMGKRVHAIVMATAPDLTPKLWYGMPAYAKGDQILLFFRDARKFKTRYATIGFSHHAKLDDGRMWPTDFALMDLTPTEESRIAALVKQAVG